MSTSLWQRRDRLGSPRFDAVVVGGGICGVSAALTFERAGLSVALIEAGSLAAGASGRNAGYLMRGMAESYAVAIERLGRERARAVWRWSEENLASLRAEGIGSTEGYAAMPSCLLATSDAEADEIRRSQDLLIEDGFESRLCDENEQADSAWRSGRFSAGLINPGDAVCQPVRVVEHLAAKLTRTRVLDGCAVHAIEDAADGEVVVRTALGDVRAPRILVCLNAYAAGVLPSLRGAVVPRRGQMLAARPLEAGTRLSFAYYANRGNEYFRQLADGTLIFGGARRFEPEDEAGEHGGVHPMVQAKLEGFLSDYVTDRYEVVARWSGLMGFTDDDLPLVGPLPGLGERAWFCGGFTGHGMSLGHLTATAAARAMVGEGERPHWARSPAEALQQENMG